jgi:hypothetical protein
VRLANLTKSNCDFSQGSEMAITRICAEAKRWVPAPAYPDFLLRSTRQDRVCGFLQGKPHAVRQSHQTRQEIQRTWDDNELFPLLSRYGSPRFPIPAQLVFSRR